MIVKLLLMLDTDTANADDVDGMGLAGGTRRELGGYSRGGARGQDSRGREGGAPGQKPLPLSSPLRNEHCKQHTGSALQTVFTRNRQSTDGIKALLAHIVSS